MDIQIINLRVPSDLAKRIRAASGPRGLTAFFIEAAEAKLEKGVPSTPPARAGVPSPTPLSPQMGPIKKAAGAVGTAGAVSAGDPFSDRVHPEPNLSKQVTPRFK